MAMINPPVFAVSTPQAFHDLLVAAGHRFAPAQRLLHWLMANLYPDHALHRSQHDVDCCAKIAAARPDPQDARRRAAVSRFDQAGATASFRRAIAAGRSPAGNEARREMVARAALCPHDHHAAAGPRHAPVVLYGGIVIPALLPQSDLGHTLLWTAHVFLGLAFFALVMLHVAAALFHALIRRDGVFAAMSPLPRRGRAG
jgi:hypothetical protein